MGQATISITFGYDTDTVQERLADAQRIIPIEQGETTIQYVKRVTKILWHELIVRGEVHRLQSEIPSQVEQPADITIT